MHLHFFRQGGKRRNGQNGAAGDDGSSISSELRLAPESVVRELLLISIER